VRVGSVCGALSPGRLAPRRATNQRTDSYSTAYRYCNILTCSIYFVNLTWSRRWKAVFRNSNCLRESYRFHESTLFLLLSYSIVCVCVCLLAASTQLHHLHAEGRVPAIPAVASAALNSWLWDNHTNLYFFYFWIHKGSNADVVWRRTSSPSDSTPVEALFSRVEHNLGNHKTLNLR